MNLNTFTYCGINSEKFKCYYAQSAEQRFNSGIDYQVYDASPDWHDGGYYYGHKVKERTFELSCYYEQIDRKTKERMMAWLDRKTSGRLYFNKTPWKYYIVRPTKRLEGQEYTHRLSGETTDVYSGTFKIVFTAYDPFAYIDMDNAIDSGGQVSLNVDRLMQLSVAIDNTDGRYDALYFTLDDNKILYAFADDAFVFEINSNNDLIMYRPDAMDGQTVEYYLNIVKDEDMPSAPTVSSKTFYLYNCGTQNAYPIIRIAGTAPNGITFTNHTNGTECKFVQLPSSGTSLEIDCGKGNVYLVDGSTKSLEYSYHDLGYLTLEPCGMIDNDVTITYTQNDNVITISDRTYDESLVDKCVLINHVWYRIVSVSDSGAIISGMPSSSGTVVTNIVNMNRIQISGEGYSLTDLQIEFVPRVQ